MRKSNLKMQSVVLECITLHFLLISEMYLKSTNRILMCDYNARRGSAVELASLLGGSFGCAWEQVSQSASSV